MSEFVPTGDQFVAACKAAFGFLEEFGFAPTREGEFCVVYQGPLFSVRARGEGYGSSTAVELVPRESPPVPLGFLIPRAKRTEAPAGQLAQITFLARQLEVCCPDLLAGDPTRLSRAQADWLRLQGRGP